MEKIIICSYWEKGSCKYMNDPDQCSFAHGEEDIKRIYCKYGINCLNIKCSFYHGNNITDSVKEISVNLFDFVKDKNKKKKQKNKKTIIPQIPQTSTSIIDIPLIDPIKNEIDEIESDKFNKNIIIINKNDNIKDCLNIGIKYHEDDLNKLLSYIDIYYITYYNNRINELEERNRTINEKFKEYRKKNENNKMSKTMIDCSVQTININNTSVSIQTNKIPSIVKSQMVDSCTQTNNDNIIKNDEKKNKLEKIYNKWITIYNIFNKYNFNYKLVKDNISELRKLIKDNNIYKVKQRCVKIFNYYQKMKINGIFNYQPISIIIKS